MRKLIGMVDAALREVERALGQPLGDDLLNAFDDDLDLVRDEWANNRAAGKREAGRVAEKIRKILSATSGRRIASLQQDAENEPPLIVDPADAPTIERVQSWFLAVAAQRHPVVVEYRAAHLADGLLREDDEEPKRNVVMWIRDRLSEERPGNGWHTHLGPMGDLLSNRRYSPWAYRRSERDWRLDRELPVPAIGEMAPAEALLVAVEALIQAFPWTTQQATHFLLAGSVPWVEQLRDTLAAHDADVAGCQRIEMSIDPGVDPAEVAKRYRRARRAVRNRDERVTREIDDKKLYLAWFDLVRQYRDGDESRPPNREQMKRWNDWVQRDHPDKVAYTENGQQKSWLYTVDTNFARDRNGVLKRIQRARATTEISFTIGGADLDG